jgi:hypothetical protein
LHVLIKNALFVLLNLNNKFKIKLINSIYIIKA